MRKSVSIVFVIIAVLTALGTVKVAIADDAYNSVLGLLAQCREVGKENDKGVNSAYWGLCHGRIEGYYTATGTWAKPKPFCAPPGTTREQLISAFVQWADNNPGKWHEPSYIGLLSALKDAFPCE